AWVSTGGGSRPTSCTVNSSGDLFVGLGGSSSGAPRVLRFNSDGTPDAAHPSYTLDTSIPPFTETWIDLQHGNECVMAYSSGTNLIREWNVCNDTALTTRVQRRSGSSAVC